MAGPCVSSIWQMNPSTRAVHRQPDCSTSPRCMCPTCVALTHGVGLGRMPAAPFCLGRLCTRIIAKVRVTSSCALLYALTTV